MRTLASSRFLGPGVCRLPLEIFGLVEPGWGRCACMGCLSDSNLSGSRWTLSADWQNRVSLRLETSYFDSCPFKWKQHRWIFNKYNRVLGTYKSHFVRSGPFPRLTASPPPPVYSLQSIHLTKPKILTHSWGCAFWGVYACIAQRIVLSIRPLLNTSIAIVPGGVLLALREAVRNTRSPNSRGRISRRPFGAAP